MAKDDDIVQFSMRLPVWMRRELEIMGEEDRRPFTVTARLLLEKPLLEHRAKRQQAKKPKAA